MRLLRSALLLTLCAAPVAAQPADTTLPAVSVVATRAAAPTAAAPARVTVLGGEAVRSSGARSVADLLEARSAAFVRRYGPGGLASLSLRGTGAAQTLVLLDGHRIADPQLGQLDLTLLPTVLLDRAEVLHGAGSALYGTDGIGGVVDLRTVRPEGQRFEVASTLGAYGERGGAGLAAFGEGRVRAVAAGEWRGEDGDFPFTDDRLGQTRTREGADRTHGSGFTRVEADLGRTTAHLAAWGGAAGRGVPGVAGSLTAARQEDRHARLWGGATSPFGWGTLRVGGLLQRASLRYRDPARALDDTGRTWLASADVEARTLAGRWLVAGGLTGGLGAADHPSLADDAREGRVGAFVSATVDAGRSPGRLLLYPALRADVYFRTGGAERRLSALPPRLGVNWQPSASLPLRLKASVGGAFRAPTFNDRFWRYAGTDRGGDPDLRPERGWTADLGAAWTRGPWQAELAGYGVWVRDQIVWRPDGGVYVPENVGRTRALGAEATARGGGLRLGTAEIGGGLTYALTDARDRSDPAAPSFGQPLRYVPRHQVKGFASAVLDLGEKTDLRLDLGGRFVSARPVRADGSLLEPAYLVTDAQLRLHHAFETVTAALALRIENALDADYAVLRGYPMPPRHARLHLHLAF